MYQNRLFTILLSFHCFTLYDVGIIQAEPIVDTGKLGSSLGTKAARNRGNEGTAGTDSKSARHDEHGFPLLHEDASLESILYHDLMKHYSKTVRPVMDHTSYINITVQMLLSQIIDVNEREQVLTTQIWLYQQWQDDFLSWNETKYPGVKYLVLPSSKVWVPDVWVTNILSDTHVTVREYLDASVGVEVKPSGMVTIWLPVYMQTFCPMRLKDFPFDKQRCEFSVASWAYDEAQLRLVPRDDAQNDASKLSDHNHHSISKQFNIIGFTHTIGKEEFPEDDRNYTYLFFALEIERKAFFFMINLLLPCYMLALIACLSYLLPPEEGDRIQLLVTVFLAIVVFVLVVLEIVPEESDTLPLFSKFLLGVMILNMVQIGQAAFANMLHTSITIRRPLPSPILRFLNALSCSHGSENEGEPAAAVNHNNVSNKAHNVILTEQGNYIAKENGNEKEAIEMDNCNKNEETDSMLDKPVEKPDHTDDWKRFFLCLDRLCFVITTLVLTFIFLSMMCYKADEV